MNDTEEKKYKKKREIFGKCNEERKTVRKKI